jgi:hypothetical protein
MPETDPKTVTPVVDTPATNTVPPPASTSSLKGGANVALGLTFDAADTRKFSLDVTALTKVTCEMVAVPPPRQLMALADRMTKTEAPKTEAPKTEAPEDAAPKA